MKLDRVTVTGADDMTPHDQLFALSERFPFVEWGILLSRSSEGGPRFPSHAWIDRLVQEDVERGAELKLSGHLCGAWVRDLCRGVLSYVDERPATVTQWFGRVQLNFHAMTHTVLPHAFAAALRAWERPEYIFQLDDVNNGLIYSARARSVRAVPLFDLSGGAGILPATWPAPSADYCGYAGGLSPDNLEEQLKRIGAAAGDSRVWIDVETHVRSDNDRLFDLSKVERFLEIAAPHVVTA